MKKELEVYLHIPFCVRKCAYCDFLSGPASLQTQRDYVNALKKEIRSFPYKEEYEVSTVFFGGGTPSLLPAEWILELLEDLHAQFAFAENPEISIECNPGTADAAKLKSYRLAGINRLSFGLQSAENRELALLGRIHTWEQFLETYEAARTTGFTSLNVDLMSALPGQTAESWENTLKRVLALHPEHISAYSLIIEEGTPFYERYREDDEKRARGEQPEFLSSEEEERLMYQRTGELLAEAGMEHYEISNYALPGYACRHNIGYWTGVEYAGFGIGAASLLAHTRYKNTECLSDYIAGKGHQEREPLSKQDEMEEFMFLGLRMMQGVSEEAFANRFGKEITQVYQNVLDRLEKEELLVREQKQIRLTPRGISLSNMVMSEFLL